MDSKNRTTLDRFEEGNLGSTKLIGGQSADAVDSPLYVVGIGASAGGLDPLEGLFDLLPSDTGMAFVVVQHLSPDFKSLMNEIMGRHTEMEVFRVEDRVKVQRNAIYLIPPGKEMIISEGRLLLTDKDPAETLTMPIDRFFRSLANDCGSRGVAIVLSGSGSDGSRGVRDVHESGGLVITQDISAAFESMPMSAQESGVVDIVAPIPEIANVLLRLSRHPLQKNISDAADPVVPEDGIKRMLREIRDAYGIDFTYYKPSTVMRRIERRLLLNHAGNLEEYVDLVVNDSEELNLLYKDLLIGVTQFFRDPEAFKLLEEKILPEMLLRIPKEQEVRVWVAGCATGEEAYSIAILLHERFSAMNRDINVKIFATDVHKTSLETASTGVYRKNSLANVSKQRLESCFTKNTNGYQIAPNIRNMVVFAAHNLIKDAPFTKMDLISCRNMLIYLQPLAQKKVLSLFHFALKTGGTLFLGPSESTGDLEDEFDSIDDHWNLFKKRRDIRLSADLRLPGGMGQMTAAPIRRPVSNDSPARFAVGPSDTRRSAGDRELLGVYNTLLDDFVPNAILVNEANELVHTFGNLDSILRIPKGPNLLNALLMLPPDIRTVVVGAMQRASRTGKPVVYSQVQMGPEDDSTRLEITVRPIIHRVSNTIYNLIAIEESERENDKTVKLTSESRTPLVIDNVSRERIDVLETQLRHNRESLQATIEELESSNEELQATNEEMVASNEELQSTNEELHSVNEELYTVNAEYQKKINELTEMSHDMNNLFNSTDVHTLFLDDTLSIRKFTPQMGQVFNLIPSDAGRRIEGFSHNIPCEDLMEKLAEVLHHGRRYEEEITMPEGNHFLLRVGPYRGETNRMGVVVTLLDITKSREAESRFRATFDNAAVGIGHVEMTGRWLRVNDRLCNILGYSKKEMLELTFEDISFPEDVALDKVEFGSLKRGEIDRYTLEKRCVRKDQSIVWVSQTISIQRDSTGTPQYSIAILQDISQRKVVETELTQAVHQRDQFLATLSHELRNPLAAARHAFSVVSHEDLEVSEKTKAMSVIDRQLQQMAHLLDDLLDVSRITQGKIRFEKLPLDMRVVVKDAADALQATIKSHNHQFSVEVPDDTVVVEGDESRLMQVVENLLTNACKYTPDGGHVELKLAVEGSDCVLSITDDGRGIDSDLLGHVFDLFVQSDLDLDRQEGGMGLGLTVVRSLVEHHNGTIQAKSEGLGKGAIFIVRLPLSKKTISGKRSIETASDTAEPSKSIRPIVVVEDNEDSREMLMTLLSLEGFEVVGCSDGRAGLEKIIEEMPPIALVDIGLPELDGYQLAKKFRAQYPDADVKLIALTGYGQESDIAESTTAGFDAHVTKPVDKSVLMPILHKFK
ncbi:ATP-binding protein [Mariniblastus sp.]|nr:ATP-binding protein [Mariniblastus sp.]